MPESIRSEILRILAGDRETIAWLYDTFAPRLVRRLGIRFAQFRDLEPDDLLHDTFIYVLKDDGRVLRRFLDRAPGEEPTRDSLDQFLWSAAGGIASNRRRSLLRHPSSSIEEQDEPRAAPGDDGPAIARDALQRLGECLQRSGECLNLYFQMRYRDGLKPGEIAQTCGWSLKKAYKLKQSLDQALEKCVEHLELSPS